MPNNSDGGISAMVLLIITVAGTLIAGFILWLLPSEWKSSIQLVLKKEWHWIIGILLVVSFTLLLKKNWHWIKFHLRHKETPEEADDRHHREMLESDDPRIWKS